MAERGDYDLLAGYLPGAAGAVAAIVAVATAGTVRVTLFIVAGALLLPALYIALGKVLDLPLPGVESRKARMKRLAAEEAAAKASARAHEEEDAAKQVEAREKLKAAKRGRG